MSEQEAQPLALQCPYCGGKFHVETEYQGSAYMQEKEVIGFTCDGCDAEWGVEGESIEMPKWVRWPGLYSKPETAEEE